MNGRLTITEVAKHIGVTARTIMRWEKMGKISRSRRDWRGWRFYLKEDMDDIKKFYESSYEFNNEKENTSMDITKATLILLVSLTSALSLPILSGDSYAQGGVVQTAPNNFSKNAADFSKEQANMTQSGAITESKTSVNVNLAMIPTVSTPPARVSEASKYTLGPNDVIEIDVRRHSEFSGKYTVTAEGKIEYKFIADVFVEGLTKLQLQERLTTILSEYIIAPEVNVQILQYLSKVYYVIGEVNRPGKFFMKGNSINVREAIIQAGLPSQSASTRKCPLITPDENSKDNMVYVNVNDLLYKGDLKWNLEMKPGDVLYIPATFIAKVLRFIRPVTDTVSSAAGTMASGAALAL